MLILIAYGVFELVAIGLLIYTIVKRISEKKQEKKNDENYKDY